ncbi:MAG: heavy metal translocating P-type ATPase, partial [Miltoncostaeaceae bacterium]
MTVRRRIARLLREPEVLVALAALAGVVAGLVLAALGQGAAANAVWGVVTGALLLPLTWSVVRTLLRRDVGVDAIALVAMAGALALQEFLAGAVVALMLAGGNALEAAAGRRARHDLEALVARAPAWAMRRGKDGEFERVPADAVEPGDVLLVRAGEVVPVDGRVEDVPALLDESALTGEPLPVERLPGASVRSGVLNAAEAFQMVATRPAAESAYAAIVRLVAEAEGRRAPFERMADRYAALLLPVTLVVAAIAWVMSGDPVRALAVL